MPRVLSIEYVCVQALEGFLHTVEWKGKIHADRGSLTLAILDKSQNIA